MPLPIDDRERYSRQVLFPGIGDRGQHLLAQAHVAVIGVGATGAATAGLLARAGVGHLTLIDRDFVEPSNLQRQVLFDESDAQANLPKAEAARLHLARINSSTRITAHIADLVPANIESLLGLPGDDNKPDLILDCTDNFETRYLLNDLCVRDARPWIYAAAVGAYAATMNILPAQSPGAPFMRSTWRMSGELQTPEAGEYPGAPGLDSETWAGSPPTACLACLFPQLPTGPTETCDTAGILSTAVNLAASIQVTEALKLLTHQPHLLRRTLLSWDLWTPGGNGEIARAEIKASTPRPSCEVCGQRIFRHLAGTARPHITLCGRNSVQIHEHHRPLDLTALQRRLQPLGETRATPHLLRFTHAPYTLTVFPDGRALIQGTTDTALARSLYARFIGS
jgi:adenylyltransferase/sulfurtransferase